MLLTVLFLLHIMWYALLTRIALKLIRGEDPAKIGDKEYEVTMKDKKRA